MKKASEDAKKGRTEAQKNMVSLYYACWTDASFRLNIFVYMLLQWMHRLTNKFSFSFLSLF
jgi:hypothetical protein